MSKYFKLYPGALALAAIGVLATLHLAFWFAPVEASMGMVQKIFYFHVPSAIATYLGFFLAFLFSVIYLLKPNDRNDVLASAGVEVGLVFCALVLTSGPLWARPIWGKYFVFDPQLTATLLLFLIYTAYVLVRMVGANSARIRKIAAVIAIFGFVDVPIIHVSVKKWGGTHPIVEREGGGGLDPDMRIAFYVGMAAFALLFVAIYWMRVQVGLRQAKVARLMVEADDMMFDAEEALAKQAKA